MYNICLRLRVACHGVKELARRLRFATTQVEVARDAVTTLHILSLMCQTVSMISALILSRYLAAWIVTVTYPAPVPRSAAGGEQRASAH